MSRGGSACTHRRSLRGWRGLAALGPRDVAGSASAGKDPAPRVPTSRSAAGDTLGPTSSPSASPARPISLKLLHASSLVYLALPYLIFAFGWLKPAFAAAVSAIVALGVYLAVRSSSKPALASAALTSPRPTTILLIVLLTASWVGLSGAGGYGYQNADYLKHNAVLKDLISQPWPVAYDLSDYQLGVAVLVYALGYYLPAALVGKVIGWPSANHALFLWTLLGALLAISWFSLLVPRRRLAVALIFVLVGGMDFLGHLLLNRQVCPIPRHQEWWAYFWAYSSNTTLLFWVPQHAIAGWIITGILIYESLYRRVSSNIIFLFALSALWSPLVTFGLIPFVGLALVQARVKNGWSLQNVFSAPAMLAIVALYYSSHSQGIPRGWLWETTDFQATWPKLITFYLLEFGVYTAAAWGAFNRPGRPMRAWWLVAIATLLVLPVYAMGQWNDFVMRASIPALFIFWLGVGNALVNWRNRTVTTRRVVLAVAFTVGALGSGAEIARSLYEPWRLKDRVGQVVLLEHAPEYLGIPDSRFFRLFASELEPVPPPRKLPRWNPQPGESSARGVRPGPAEREC
jgi:hypothetical protein